jgi:hypothetical protein
MHYTIYKKCGNTLHYLSFIKFIFYHIYIYFLKYEDKMQIKSLLLIMRLLN